MNDFQPLAGVRVLDFTHVIAGPMATFYLTRLGAEVTKVENRSGGDVMRRGHSTSSFVALNAGKESIALDLSNSEDQSHALALAQQADVLVDSLRPGVLERFGLGEVALRALNPRLIYCAISGYGRQGPWADRPTYDHVIQAATGMMLLGGKEGDPPIKTGFPVVDAGAGILAALAIVAALRERDSTGRGRFIDVAMSASAMQLMYPMACEALTAGRNPPRVGNQGYSYSPAADVFETTDGWIALGANTPRQFGLLLGVLDRLALLNDSALFNKSPSADAPAEFLTVRDPVALRAALAEAIRTWATADLEAACVKAKVPAARVRTIAEFAGEAQAAGALGTIDMELDGTRATSPGLGFRVS